MVRRKLSRKRRGHSLTFGKKRTRGKLKPSNIKAVKNVTTKPTPRSAKTPARHAVRKKAPIAKPTPEQVVLVKEVEKPVEKAVTEPVEEAVEPVEVVEEPVVEAVEEPVVEAAEESYVAISNSPVRNSATEKCAITDNIRHVADFIMLRILVALIAPSFILPLALLLY